MLTFDFTNILEGAIGGRGLRNEDFKHLDVASAHNIIAGRKRPDLAFLDLHKADLSAVREAGAFARKFESFVILGIGGSALGPRSILEAVNPLHNYRGTPRVFIYDNVDPMTLVSILSVIDLKTTAINVISKSGSTAETMASFMILWRKLKDAGLKPEDHVIVTTDPAAGNLRSLVKDFGLRSLAIEPGVGGRYSVLSPVGLLLAETAGIPAKDLLSGAADIERACLSPDLWKNPAYLFAAGTVLMSVLRQRGVTVMIPYADRLKCFAEWFCQLWAESLGKEGRGLTPYPSVGTTDQHSQLQLWMEGPEDKVVVFLAVEDYGADMEIPQVFPEREGLAYLGGHGLAELIRTEQEASEIALTKRGRPSITIRLPRIDTYHLGQLFHLFEIATVAAGMFLGIDPFGQPGVEEGKNLTYGMMGKKGHEEKRREFEEYRKRSFRVVL